MIIPKDMPKLECPYKRIKKGKRYIVTPEVNEGYDWVFNDPRVIATRKMDGTNVSIIVKDHIIVGVYNRKNVVYTNDERSFIMEGIKNSIRDRIIVLDNIGDGQYFGELIGPKINGNPHSFPKHYWYSFDFYLHKNYLFRDQIVLDDFNLVSESMKQRHDNSAYFEGLVFVHPDGRMAKLRCDMFDWYKGKPHKRRVSGS